MVAENPLKKEFEYYLANQADLLSKYEGKFVVIKDEQVIGVFDTQFEAYEQVQKAHPLGTFLIQQVSKGDESYTQTFHSRVMV